MVEKHDLRQLVLPGFDEGEMFDNLPYSHFRRWTERNDIYDHATQNFPLGRLHRVKALSFLSYVGPDPENTMFLEYSHTRYDHSLVVALVSEQILKQNGFPQEDINLGVIAGLVHDIATPGYGDATKKVDPEALDEEKFWWEALGKKGQDFLTQKLGISKEKLGPIIKNKGILGQVLDVADRITYTMKDLNAIIVEDKELYGSLLTPKLNPYLITLRYIVSQYSEGKIGDIYKEVGVDRKKQKIFFNDPQHLGTFLLLRAHLHQSLYLHPTSQGRDLFISQLIKPLYSRNGEKLLTPEKLRNMGDDNLLQILEEQYESERDYIQMRTDLVNWHPKFEKFETIEEAEKFEQKIKRRKNIAVIGISACKGFDPATTYEVADKQGNIMPFREFDPQAAREIEEIAKSTKGIYVFWADVSQDTPANNLIRKVCAVNNS